MSDLISSLMRFKTLSQGGGMDGVFGHSSKASRLCKRACLSRSFKHPASTSPQSLWRVLSTTRIEYHSTSRIDDKVGP